MKTAEEIKFTPGPWRRDGVVIWGQTRPVAQCVFLDTRYPLESDEGNARLISATPDLYALLTRAADMLSAIAGDLEDGHSLASVRGKYVMALVDCRDDARAALSKARGEA